MTPQALIDTCASQLLEAGVALGQGTLYAEDEAAWLVLWSLGWPLDTDTTELNDPLPPQAIEKVMQKKVSIWIFPEGTRAYSKKQKVFLKVKIFFPRDQMFFLKKPKFFPKDQRFFLKDQRYLLRDKRYFLKDKKSFVQDQKK
mgnify:CR=1 FL=1